nr:hypothetical protein MACL_00003325 [Theileria orientalis]
MFIILKPWKSQFRRHRERDAGVQKVQIEMNKILRSEKYIAINWKYKNRHKIVKKMKLNQVKIGVFIALLATLIHMVGADSTDYTKIKDDMKLKSSKSLEGQRSVLAKINKVSEILTTEGERSLSDFKSYVGRLIPYLSQPTSEPFIDNIQEYINSKTGDRQQIIKVISDIKMYQKRAEKEIANSEKRYNKLLQHLSKSNENDKSINHAKSQYKGLALAKDRLLEINQRIAEFGPIVTEKIEHLALANKKLDVYKLFLEMLKRTRGIVVESRKAYVGSFSTKDKILDSSNRMDSLVKRAKLVKGDSKNKSIYKAETEKLNSLWDELNKLKNNILTNSKSAAKTLEHMNSTVIKGEGYEKSIIDEGSSGSKSSSDSANSSKGVDTLSRAFLRAKETYNKLTKLQKSTAEDVATMEKYNKETAELLKKGNSLVGEMEGISKKRSSMAKKTLNLSTPQDLREMVGMDDVASDDSDSSSESETEESAKDAKKTEDADKDRTKTHDSLDRKADLSKRATKRKTRKQLDEIRNKAIGSYLDDIALSDEGSGSKNSEASDSDNSYDSDASTETSLTGKITKSKKDPKSRKPTINSRGASSDITSESSESSSPVNDKKNDKGLIDRGFNFLKKLAAVPQTFFETADSLSAVPSSEDVYYDARESIQDTEDSDTGVDSDVTPKAHIPTGRSRNHRTPGPPSYNQTGDPLKPSHVRAASAGSQGIRYSAGDAPIDLRQDEEEDYKRAVKESVVMDLERKAKEAFDSNQILNLSEAGSKGQQDLFKLVRLSYELKKQFELVKDEFKSSFQFNQKEILKNTLKDLLHQYLSGVCSAALEMTRPRNFQMFTSNSGGLFAAGTVQASAGANPNRAYATPNSQPGNRRVSVRTSGMQGNPVTGRRVATKRSYGQMSGSESNGDYGSFTPGRANAPRVAVVTTQQTIPQPQQPQQVAQGVPRAAPKYVSQQVQMTPRPVPAQRRNIRAPMASEFQAVQPLAQGPFTECKNQNDLSNVTDIAIIEALKENTS